MIALRFSGPGLVRLYRASSESFWKYVEPGYADGSVNWYPSGVDLVDAHDQALDVLDELLVVQNFHNIALPFDVENPRSFVRN